MFIIIIATLAIVIAIIVYLLSQTNKKTRDKPR
jgi:cbb3-type cytochrome oxidase subunit 3